MNMQKKIVFCCLAFVSLLFPLAYAQTPKASSPPTPRYRDASLSIEDRVADLLSRMTLEEKVDQISGGRQSKLDVIDPTGTFNTQQARDTMNRWWDPDLPFSAKRAAILRNGIQRYLKEKTRLGIPELFMGEALHGFMEDTSTSFPQALGLAST